MKIRELDSKSVATMFSSVRVLRDHPTKVLTPIELENYVSQAAWKFFSQSRTIAAERLGVGEMDLITTDVRVVGIKIDGHQVINPTGFTGRQLELILSVSMSKEGTSDQAIPIEGGAVRAHMIANLKDLERAYYIESDEGLTTVFSMDNGSVRHLSSFDWGRKDIASRIVDTFGIEEEFIWPVYVKYVEGNISEGLLRRFDKVFFDSFTGLVNATSMIIRNEGALKRKEIPPIYINAPFGLPDKVFRKRFSFDTNKHVCLQRVEEDLDIESFLDNSSNNIYEDLNELARRRIKWATPQTISK
jgi:hypothetical protein